MARIATYERRLEAKGIEACQHSPRDLGRGGSLSIVGHRVGCANRHSDSTAALAEGMNFDSLDCKSSGSGRRVLYTRQDDFQGSEGIITDLIYLW
ncbi:hypothetical protein GALMADRAFT_138551 [Galerina marginata CBS 339.88]|uniref:Uncharacterized protein n=1 Tax=Galerina marginata (strain CBS 339.88) TaxID=685588 RepID=A0A067T2S4_GALM3|nr:hypothetical protein GALMADRAFT_138551 [Galerina marginata CBS 339.88]